MKGIIYFENTCYNFSLDKENTYTFSCDSSAHYELPALLKQDDFTISFQQSTNQWVLEQDQEASSLTVLSEGWTTFKTQSNQTVRLCILKNLSEHLYSVEGIESLFVSNTHNADIVIGSTSSFYLNKSKNEEWSLFLFNGDVYVNGEKVQKKKVTVFLGDHIQVGENTLICFAKEIAVKGNHEVTRLQSIKKLTEQEHWSYEEFYRSPRLIYREPEEKITVKNPPQEPHRSAEQLLRMIVPPAIMMTVSIAMAFLRPNAWFVLATVAMTASTIVFSLIRFFRQKKKHKIESAQRIENYNTYLAVTSKKLYELSQKQKQSRHYHFPSVDVLQHMVEKYDSRLFEKKMTHFDFLHYRIGRGNIPSSLDLEYGKKDYISTGDDLEDKGFALFEHYQELDNMPIVSDLVHGPIGYIGDRSLVVEQLHLMINQLAVFHSYHDLQFISIFPEHEKKLWDWMRWMPHFNLKQWNLRGFIYNQRTRDQLLSSLNTVLKDRQHELNEQKNKNEQVVFKPHYVVFITDESLIMDHVIMDFFSEDPSELGCSIIYIEDVLSSLSENVQTVIDVRDKYRGNLIMKESELVNQTILFDHFPDDFNMNLIPRRLAGVNHVQNLKSSIPDSVTFLQMYQVDRVEELNARKRWSEHAPFKSLEVPLGLRGKDDIVNLNLHEKAHGPHGLIAGTTGSGKSEIIQSYILSLAINFHPHDIAFLLVDYKGGGMANLFRDLPHLVGTITNLDKAQSMRALISINAELKRRQRIFSEYNVNHIHQYQKLRKQGKAKEPIPDLFIISDEFAELKSDQPEFMDELISTARIGRSLGIHLILATQKPSGVVNEQIWSNSRFKLALKVADKQDSMEILKTSDASEITQVGRAYLQVGNNEIYELFQSAYSGADYRLNENEQHIENLTFYRINQIGQYEVLNQDLSGLDKTVKVERVPSELEAVVKYTEDTFNQTGDTRVAKPWLPPLPEKLPVSELNEVDYKEEWNEWKDILEPVVGKIDLPKQQAQEMLQLNLTNDGHVAVFGSPGYGKSTFLQTILMDSVRKHSPKRLHIYLLDFATNGLLPLRYLPHTADNLTLDDEVKVRKFIRRMEDEIKRRKNLLSEYAVAHLAMYQQASGHLEPSIIIAIDGYDGLKDSDLYEDLNKSVTLIAREGVSIGIHLVMSATRQNAMRSTLYSNIKTVITLKMNDENEERNIVGRSEFILEDVKGRGLIKLDEPQVFHTALPADGENELQVIENVRKEAQEMSEYWTGERPLSIPMVPEVLDFESFINKLSVNNAVNENLIPLGLDFERVEAVSFSMQKFKHLLLVGDQEEAITTMQKHLISVFAVVNGLECVVFDTEHMLENAVDETMHYITDKDEIRQYIEQIRKLINEEAIEQQMIVFIQNVRLFLKASGLSDNDFKFLYEEGPAKGYHFIFSSNAQFLNTSYETIPKYLKANSDRGILSMRQQDQNIFDKKYNQKESYLEVDEAYVYQNRSFTKIKITRD